MFPLDRILKVPAVASIIIFALAVPCFVNAQDWSLTGNAGTNPATNFLGTQDNSPLLIKTNGIEAISISPGRLKPARIGGNIGIGTTSPGAKLHVHGDTDPLLLIDHAGASGNPALWFQQDKYPQAYVWWDKANSRLNLGTRTTNPIVSLQNDGTTLVNGPLALQNQAYVWWDKANSRLNLGTRTTNPIVSLQNDGTTLVNGPLALQNNRTRLQGFDGAGFHWFGPTPDNDLAFGIKRTAANNYEFNVRGAVFTRTLQITGGADLSEHFEVRAAEVGGAVSPIQAGLVVSINPDEPGKLVISRQAYDHKVAGVISGAGGVRPGVLMSQSGSMTDGDHPVALTGRVYCWADATYGPIAPGDPLTTSDTAGHAMKVTDYAKAQGAVLGKAMSGLKQGKGLVLVLVTLQ
jgi:hypothetical protein